MSGRGYFDRIWESVPEGGEPEHFTLRRDFLLGEVTPGMRVLDVGCGEGAFAAALGAAGAQPIGIEVAAAPLRRAGRRHGSLDLRLVSEGEALPFEGESFDLVWAGEVLEHVVDAVRLLDELFRVLVPGGRLVISTPSHPVLRVLWLALAPRAFDSHFDPRSDHVRFFSARTLRVVLLMAGFEDVRIRGAGGLPALRRVLLATARKPGG